MCDCMCGCRSNNCFSCPCPCLPRYHNYCCSCPCKCCRCGRPCKGCGCPQISCCCSPCVRYHQLCTCAPGKQYGDKNVGPYPCLATPGILYNNNNNNNILYNNNITFYTILYINISNMLQYIYFYIHFYISIYYTILYTQHIENQVLFSKMKLQHFLNLPIYPVLQEKRKDILVLKKSHEN